MNSTSVVFQADFDSDFLDRVNELRQFRLASAKKMLQDIDRTCWELSQQGLSSEEINKRELVGELNHRIETYESRLKNPEQIHEDELSLYVDLLASDQ